LLEPLVRLERLGQVAQQVHKAHRAHRELRVQPEYKERLVQPVRKDLPAFLVQLEQLVRLVFGALAASRELPDSRVTPGRVERLALLVRPVSQATQATLVRPV